MLLPRTIVAHISACMRLLLVLAAAAVALGCSQSSQPEAAATPTPTAPLVVDSCFPVPTELGDAGPMEEQVVNGITVSTAGGVAYADRDRIIEGLVAAQEFVASEFGGVTRPVCVDIRGDDTRAGSALTIRNRIIVFTERGGWERPYPWLLSRAVAHEYIHVWATEASNDFAMATSTAYGPGWLTEGLAEHLSMRIVLEARLAPAGEAEAFTNTLLRLNTLPLSALASLPLPSAEDYATAELAASELLEGKAVTSVRRYYEALGDGVTWQAAFRDAFGVDADAFVRQFDASP